MLYTTLLSSLFHLRYGEPTEVKPGPARAWSWWPTAWAGCTPAGWP
jgi:hypothetical protein